MKEVTQHLVRIYLSSNTNLSINHWVESQTELIIAHQNLIKNNTNPVDILEHLRRFNYDTRNEEQNITLIDLIQVELSDLIDCLLINENDFPEIFFSTNEIKSTETTRKTRSIILFDLLRRTGQITDTPNVSELLNRTREGLIQEVTKILKLVFLGFKPIRKKRKSQLLSLLLDMSFQLC